MPVPTQQDAEIVEPGHDSLQFHTVDEENCEGSLLLTNVIKESVLEVLCALSHQSFYPVLPPDAAEHPAYRQLTVKSHSISNAKV
jgi:hypothetical protein